MAYSVHLDQFDGPLDLLLHLISEAELDIKDIFVSEITSQYLAYLSELDSLDMDSASEFVNMAATLLYIKSRQLLPKPTPPENPDEEDPAELLIRQLKDYQAFKKASEALRVQLEQAGQSFSKLPEDLVLPPQEYELEGATLDALVSAFEEILARSKSIPAQPSAQRVALDTFTVRGQISKVRACLEQGATSFSALFPQGAERMELIVTFMALLEMLRHGEVHLKQPSPFAEIQIIPKQLMEDGDSRYDYLDEELD